jgi:hypothetical protein
MTTRKIVLAAPLRPSFAYDHDAIPKNRFAPGKRMIPKSGVRFSDKIMRREGRRSAERRIVLPIAACAAAHPDQMRPPSGASPRHSPPALTPMAQPQNRVSRHLELAGVLPAYILASVKRAPRRPVLLPVDRCPRAARVRIGNSARGHRPSLRPSGMPSGQAPVGEQGETARNHTRDDNQDFVLFTVT